MPTFPGGAWTPCSSPTGPRRRTSQLRARSGPLWAICLRPRPDPSSADYMPQLPSSACWWVWPTGTQAEPGRQEGKNPGYFSHQLGGVHCSSTTSGSPALPKESLLLWPCPPSRLPRSQYPQVVLDPSLLTPGPWPPALGMPAASCSCYSQDCFSLSSLLLISSHTLYGSPHVNSYCFLVSCVAILGGSELLRNAGLT